MSPKNAPAFIIHEVIAYQTTYMIHPPYTALMSKTDSFGNSRRSNHQACPAEPTAASSAPS